MDPLIFIGLIVIIAIVVYLFRKRSAKKSDKAGQDRPPSPGGRPGENFHTEHR